VRLFHPVTTTAAGLKPLEAIPTKEGEQQARFRVLLGSASSKRIPS
jgi:hypothetical protein